MFARSKNQLFSQLLRCSLAPGSGPRAGGWRAKNGSFFSLGFICAGFWIGTFLTFSENRYWSGLMLTFHWQVWNKFALHINSFHSSPLTTTFLNLMGNLCDQRVYSKLSSSWITHLHFSHHSPHQNRFWSCAHCSLRYFHVWAWLPDKKSGHGKKKHLSTKGAL